MPDKKSVVPEPAPAPKVDQLPYPLTFFLNSIQRARVLRELRQLDRDRTRALCMVLGIESESISKNNPARH